MTTQTSRPLRIALVSTLRTSVPPRKTGSVELLVGLMARELDRRGHDVTVFATADSSVPGRLVSVLPVGYHDDHSIWDWRLAEFMQMGAVFERADEFDVIHSHAYIYALPFSRLTRTPIVHTFHISPTPDFVRFCAMYPEDHYVLISHAQRRTFADLPVAGVVHNGIDTEAFDFEPRSGDYLVFIGDIRADKRPLDAVRLARAAGVPIRIAGPATDYFREVVEPELDDFSATYVGEVDHAEKVALLKGALASVFFPAFGESCPLVILESMACGTPVWSVGEGPVPELVDPGVGGLWARDVGGMLALLPNLRLLDRRRVRRNAVERFDISRMVDDYLAIYERVSI